MGFHGGKQYRNNGGKAIKAEGGRKQKTVFRKEPPTDHTDKHGWGKQYSGDRRQESEFNYEKP
jgi:hypothetical protein